MSAFNTFVTKNADDIGFSQRNDWFGLFAEQFFQAASRRTQKYEAGMSSKTIQTAIRIAKALNSTVEELWGNAPAITY